MSALPVVICVASSAVFDLGEGDAIYRRHGREAYRSWQRAHEDEPLSPGVAFPFVRRFLALRDLDRRPPVEVILLSRNDPDTGLRVRLSLDHHGLPVERCIFTGGDDPFPYAADLGAVLFLSANADDCARSVASGLPAGTVLPSPGGAEDAPELRMAFDFDGVLADDASEQVYAAQGLAAFQAHESALIGEAAGAGPLAPLFRGLAALRELDAAQALAQGRQRRIRTAIITARSHPADRRVLTTLRSWGIGVDEAFFIGDLPKDRILRRWRPHIFFDDRLANAQQAALVGPSVHVPFGIRGRPDGGGRR